VVEVYENALVAANPARSDDCSPAPPVATRGRVTSFSPASRRRLRRLLSTVRWSQLPPARFVTLTLHRVPEDWHRRFGVWLQWLRDQDAVYIWRLEAQQRGAPHWHLILWCSDECAAGMRAAWHRTAAAGSRAHHRYGLRVDVLDSYRAASCYVAKYVAKSAGPLPKALRGHRHWGASRSLPCRAIAEADLSERQYYALRRIMRGLMRARARTRKHRCPSPRTLHLFCSQETSAAICAHLGLIPRPPPPPPPPLRAPGRAALPLLVWSGACWEEPRRFASGARPELARPDRAPGSRGCGRQLSLR
jgi:hypothetical protein